MGHMPRDRANARRSKTLHTYPRTLGINLGTRCPNSDKNKGLAGVPGLEAVAYNMLPVLRLYLYPMRRLPIADVRRELPHAGGLPPRLARGAHPQGGRKAEPRQGQKSGVWSKNPNAAFPQRLWTGHHSPNVLISPQL